MRWISTLLLFALAIAPTPHAARAAELESIRVMTFNLWHGGESGKQPLSQSAKVIEAAKADIVGLQETAGKDRVKRPDKSPELAKLLGWHQFFQGRGNAVISRYPIMASTPSKAGVQLQLPQGKRVWVFNVHLAPRPYQPHQLKKIVRKDTPFLSTADEAIAGARQTRGPEIDRVLAEIKAVAGDRTPIFVVGDFNEPSPLDWTPAVAEAKRIPLAVEWPTAGRLTEAGLVDAFRHFHPDPLKHPGYTWTSIKAEDDPQDHPDRIDYLYVGGKGATIDSVEIVGEKPERADIVVQPYPSDHRAVVATIKLN
jgi:exonuclease III